MSQSTAQHYCTESDLVIRLLDKYHYRPLPFNEQLSKNVYKEFINMLDVSGIYFLSTEVDSLSKWENILQADIRASDCQFLALTTRLYKQGLLRADSIINKIEFSDLDFNRKDTLYLNSTSHHYAETLGELKERWMRLYKYKLLNVIYGLDENKEKYKNIKDVAVEGPDIIKKITIREKRNINVIINDPQGFEHYVADCFFNAITLCYDPHSSYFSPVAKQRFEERLSTQGFSFGLVLDETENDMIKIDRLVPGSPAWKSNQLNKDDIILQVTFENGQPIDMTYADLEDVNRIFGSNDSKTMELKIKKADGQIRTVKLTKAKIKEEDNRIKSYIITSDKKIGYISLPGFYTDYDAPKAMGCSNDVAKEIVKLQKESISGLIIDLRYNGGGSVQEALGLAGIFIDMGPLVIFKSRDEKPFSLKDLNRGVIYSGPLMVMVNGYSASASEMFANAMQDYNRAIIVGSQTYGKGSGQAIISLDSVTSQLPSINKNDKWGFVKVTSHMFYKITGNTHQARGVIPDIKLPEAFSFNISREFDNVYAIAPDSVSKKVYYTPGQAFPINELVAKSKIRIDSSSKFQSLIQVNDSINELFKQENNIALQLNPFFDFQNKIKRLSLKIVALISSQPSDIEVNSTRYDAEIAKLDQYYKLQNESEIQTIKNDMFIEEACRIMNDLISKITQ